MQNPTDQAEASISTETAVINNDPNLNHPVTVCRKAAKRTLPFDLATGELNLLSLSPQAEGIPAARKKPRLEEPLPPTTDEAAGKAASPDVTVGLSPAATAADGVNADLVMGTQPNAGASTRVSRRWTLEDDAKLTSAVANTPRKKRGEEYKTSWDAVAALIPGRTEVACRARWHGTLVSNMDPTTARAGKWTEDKDKKLKDAVQTHGGKNWSAIAALVPGRTKSQCLNRWHNTLNQSTALVAGHTGKWAEDEDKKLKDAVLTHSGTNWPAVSELIPGRTRSQCWYRWYDVLDPGIGMASGRTGKWTADEDSKLKDAVHTHGGNNWPAIVALVPGRTRIQCYNRWHDNIDRATGRTGKWTAVEDSKLKDAVQTHGGKNWPEISLLVPGRTKSQCCSRWHDALDPNIDRATGRTGRWAKHEDKKLKDAVQTHGCENWGAIAALVSGRTKSQCSSRWKKCIDPNRSTVRATELITLYKAHALG
jgi:hypothetical protein